MRNKDKVYYKIRRNWNFPIRLGFTGMEFVRKGDTLLYLNRTETNPFSRASSENSDYVEVRFLGGASELHRGYRVRLLAPYEERTGPKGYNRTERNMSTNEEKIVPPVRIPVGRVIDASENELYWDPERQIPAERLAEFISSRRSDR